MPEKLPNPESENCNVVLVGSFNPAIFHPEWFYRQHLIGEDAREASVGKIKVISSDVTECEAGAVKVFCTDTRLVLSVRNMVDATRLQDLAVGILRILTHVPVTAVGINHEAVFRAESEEHWHKIGHTLAPKDLVWNKICEKPGMQQIRIKSRRSEQPLVEENFMVGPGSRPPNVQVQANLHFQMSPPTEVPTSGESTNLAATFLTENWNSATLRAREVAAVIFEEIAP